MPKSILARYREAFINAAQAFIANPASTHLREQLEAYPNLVTDWELINIPTGRDDWP